MIQEKIVQKSVGQVDGTKEVAILLTDMVSYSQKTAPMTPEEIRDFIIEYHETIQRLINTDENQPLTIEPSAGDGAIFIFESRPGEGKEEKCRRALTAAMELASAIEAGTLPDTRIGAYYGDIIEAKVGNKVVKFGSSFAVASRLEELCNFFRTPVLMDRDIAKCQDYWKKYLVHVGKVTPKNFTHPIHILTVYPPSLYNCIEDIDEEKLLQFIAIKNKAIELFCGNRLLKVEPDFPKVRELLGDAQRLFAELTGRRDIATDRILDYIREYPYPDDTFFSMGMKILRTKGDSLGSRLFRLSKQFLKAMDLEFYNALVVDTSWEEKFKIEWWKRGEVILRVNDKADGIFYIDSGDVNTLNKEGDLITTLAAGDIFGEMAYFSREKRRNATVVANSDVVLRRITTEDFSKLPTIKKIFQRIATRRHEERA